MIPQAIPARISATKAHTLRANCMAAPTRGARSACTRSSGRAGSSTERRESRESRDSRDSRERRSSSTSCEASAIVRCALGRQLVQRGAFSQSRVAWKKPRLVGDDARRRHFSFLVFCQLVLVLSISIGTRALSHTAEKQKLSGR